jgi:hypothetical protein
MLLYTQYGVVHKNKIFCGVIMNKEYLLTPVIETNDGEELKSFRMYYLVIFAFFFGLIPTVILCVRNCLWLGAKKITVILIIALSTLFLIIKFTVLGTYYSENSQQLKASHIASSDNYVKNIKNKNNTEKITEKENSDPVLTNWESYKDNLLIIEKIFSLLLLGITYLIYKGNYKIVLRLTGNIQPLLKWAVICIVIYYLFQIVMANLIFGGLI